MSLKMKKFLDKPIKKKPIVEVKQTPKMPQNLINEAVTIEFSDKELLYHFIEQPGNQQFVLSTYSDEYPEVDRTVVISRKSGNMVLLILNSEFEEISDFIVEMCDEMGWKFFTGVQEDTGKIVFTIFVT